MVFKKVSGGDVNCIYQELEALKTELEDSLDTTAAVQDLRTKREQELQELKRTLEQSQRTHEEQLQEMRSKYNQQIETLNEEVENARKVRMFIFFFLH